VARFNNNNILIIIMIIIQNLRKLIIAYRSSFEFEKPPLQKSASRPAKQTFSWFYPDRPGKLQDSLPSY
jgi:hypothetical protein